MNKESLELLSSLKGLAEDNTKKRNEMQQEKRRIEEEKRKKEQEEKTQLMIDRIKADSLVINKLILEKIVKDMVKTIFDVQAKAYNLEMTYEEYKKEFKSYRTFTFDDTVNALKKDLYSSRDWTEEFQGTSNYVKDEEDEEDVFDLDPTITDILGKEIDDAPSLFRAYLDEIYNNILRDNILSNVCFYSVIDKDGDHELVTGTIDEDFFKSLGLDILISKNSINIGTTLDNMEVIIDNILNGKIDSPYLDSNNQNNSFITELNKYIESFKINLEFTKTKKEHCEMVSLDLCKRLIKEYKNATKKISTNEMDDFSIQINLIAGDESVKNKLGKEEYKKYQAYTEHNGYVVYYPVELSENNEETKDIQDKKIKYIPITFDSFTNILNEYDVKLNNYSFIKISNKDTISVTANIMDFELLILQMADEKAEENSLGGK